MRFFIFFFILALLFAAAFVGKVSIDIHQLNRPESLESTIFYQLRLPRILLAFLSGGILALSGLLFQILFRNPLTTPFTLGISSGATLGAAIAILLGLNEALLGFSLISLFAFLGALMTIALISYFSGRLSQAGDQRLILVGIALSFFFSSLLLILYYFSNYEESYRILRFTMGSLSTVGWIEIIPLAIGTCLLLFVAFYYREALQLLSISYEFAYLKGLDVKRMTLLFFVVVSIAVGLMVSITGPIGFVGLIIPHIVKQLFRQSSDRLSLFTFLGGGLFLVLCDTITRAMPTISEVPVGVITSLIGGIIFIVILLKKAP